MPNDYPAFFSSLDQEISAYPDPGIFFMQWEMAYFEIAGPDSRTFLQAIGTQDFTQVPEGGVTRSCFLQNNGRLLAIANFFCVDSNCWLVQVDAAYLEGLRTHLEKYIILEEVALGPVLDWAGIQILSSKTENLKKDFPEITKLSDQKLHTVSPELRIYKSTDWHSEAIGFLIPKAELPQYFEKLAGLGYLPAGWQTVLALEVLHGKPRMGLDFTQEMLPLEVWEKDSISFNKGCYLGQEIIARIESRAHVVKAIAHLKFDVAVEIPQGTQLMDQNRTEPAGIVTRAIHDGQNSFCLAILKYEYLASGKILTLENIDNVKGTVVQYKL